MKLSILIPTHNYDCGRLVRQLLLQLPDESEIIIGDDCSADADIVKKIDAASSLPNCHVFRQSGSEPLGRAAIRNALAREARGEWILFIDADAEVRSPSFIADYLAAAEGRAEDGKYLDATAPVVCGGTGNLPCCPRPAARLRYDYEVAAEKRLTLTCRQKHPYAQFTTFNFLIQRKLFLSIGFNESLREYGHEDTLFGLELKRRGIAIRHIDNKLTHLGIEDSSEYLAKTETALRTLASMDIEQKRHVRISALALHMKRRHLHGLVSLLFRMGKPFLRTNLLGKHPIQILFAFYKLGYYSTEDKTLQ